jgi:hypothetical protein
MSSEKEREGRAFEALVVSLLRRDCDPDKVKPESLPKLTAKEKAAIEALGPDLIEELWNSGRTKSSHHVPGETSKAGVEFAMNRAEEIDAETSEELRLKREEILERIRKKREATRDA